MKTNWWIAVLVGVAARVAFAEVAFVPEYPMPGLDGVPSGAVLSWSGPAADATFEFLRSMRMPVRTEGGDAYFPQVGNIQEVSSTQVGCVRFYHGATHGLGSVESTHCSTRFAPGAAAAYWGTVRTNNFGFFDAGMKENSLTAQEQQKQSTINVQKSRKWMLLRVSGAAAQLLAATKPSRQAISCSGAGAKSNCSFRIDSAGRVSSR